MIKKAVIAALMLIVLTGCGYKMSLQKGKAAFTIYPAEIVNRSTEVTVNQTFINEVKSYLASINALAKEDTADYKASFNLSNVNTSSAVKLKSGETATASVSVTVLIEVKDKTGKQVMNDSASASTTYSQTSSSSASAMNKQEAIRNAVRYALENFRYRFENR